MMESAIGHNSKAADELKDGAREVLALRKQKRELGDKEKGIKATLKKSGWNITAFNKIIAELEMQEGKHKELVEDMNKIRDIVGDQLEMFGDAETAA